MCKRLFQKLFPLDLFGKHKQTIVFDTTNTPVLNSTKEFNIIWEGEMLLVSYTELNRRAKPAQTYYTPTSKVLYNGAAFSLITKHRILPNGTADTINNNVLHINCTNVQSLSINGEKII